MTTLHSPRPSIADNTIEKSFSTADFYSKKTTHISVILIFLTIFAATFLQKIGPTFGSFQFYFSLPLLYLIIVIGFTSGAMEVHVRRSIAFCGCFGVLITEQIVSGKDFSLPSLALLMVVHVPYIFGFKSGTLSSDKTLRIFQNFLCIISVLGIIQFVSQFIIGSRYAFFLDFYFPEIIIKMANINPIHYGSSILRSTGIFFTGTVVS